MKMKNLVLTIVAAALVGSCSDSCENVLVKRIESTGSNFSAVLFRRDCGATTGFSSHISILKRGDAPSGGGNALRADDDHGAARVGDWDGVWADMKWVSPTHLAVRYAAKSRIFLKEDHVSGVYVTYYAVDPLIIN